MDEPQKEEANLPQANELEEIKKQRDEYLSGWQRAKADFINYKKEEMKHLEEVARYGNVDLIKDMISVLDNFDLGLRSLEKAGPVEKGVYLIKFADGRYFEKAGSGENRYKTWGSIRPNRSRSVERSAIGSSAGNGR
jgi:hypothetical protein